MRSSPTQVGSLTNWSKVKLGWAAAAIKTDGTLWNWGEYRGMAINIRTGYPQPNSDVSSPTQVGTDTNWSQISNSGQNNFKAIRTNGTLWGWGRNLMNVLGTGDYGRAYSSPVQIGTSNTWTKLHDTNILAASRLIY
jgi:alpha-tubulin suppressor-like RCC1 family protein